MVIKPLLFFKITCGVKQGGILSLFFFNIYMDKPIEERLTLNIGGKIRFCEYIIEYCDDIFELNKSK